MDVSIVIPIYNESESIIPLGEEIVSVCQENNFKTEVIFVNDGSTDKSWSKVNDMTKRRYDSVFFRGINFRKNLGKSNALNEGFKYVLGQVVITMDADLQDNPIEIPKFVNLILNMKFDLVSGWKKNRKDPISKTLPVSLHIGKKGL